MKGRLDKPKLNYLYFHINHSFKLTPEIKNKIRYYSFNELSGIPINNGIYFPLSEKPFDLSSILYIDSLPVLFPVNQSEKRWYTLENGSLVFHHDILKSAFYLLSGYQENYKNHYDNLGRYRYDLSIQNKLTFVLKPLVNYYFETIIQGIEKYCKYHGIAACRRKIFMPFGFLLTHDVDRVDKYHFWEMALKILQMLGMRPNPFPSKKVLCKVTLNYILNFFKLRNDGNSFWNFDYLITIEKQNNLRSVFYFLDNEGRHDNARYRLEERRIHRLINYLSDESCEIGLHATTFSVKSQQYMDKCLNNLQKHSPQRIIGNRQHYLKFDRQVTPMVLSKAGIKYDTTLGFPQHEGFRNSYCLPFKLFDFQSNEMLDLWELPLNVMDGTLFYYRKLSYQQMHDVIKQVINEIKKFNGLFTLLWHNSHFDESEFPGIHNFYEELLHLIASQKPENLTGTEILQKIDSISIE